MNKLFSVFFKKQEKEPVVEEKECKRSYEDLALDVKQKRKLTNILLQRNRRLRNSLRTYVSASLVAILFLTLSVFKQKAEVLTFNRYYSNFKNRYISTYGLGLTNNKDYKQALELVDKHNILIESQMINVLSSIERKDYDKALFMLSEINSPEAEWLNGLCLLRIKENEKACMVFENIVKEEGLFSAEAKEILKKHYAENTSN